MILDERVLQKLAEWQPPGGRQTLHVPLESGWSLAVTTDRHDELGSLVWDVTVQRAGPAPAGATLAGWARRIAERVTGLMESLKVVEIDDVRNEALLRSQEPAQRGEKILYYEALVQGTRSVSVRRYRAGANGQGRREQAVFAATNETLAKLVVDLTAEE